MRVQRDDLHSAAAAPAAPGGRRDRELLHEREVAALDDRVADTMVIPAARRERGYYALPLLWREAVIGWANLSVRDGRLVPELGWVAGRRPRDAALRVALDEELGRVADFLSAR